MHGVAGTSTAEDTNCWLGGFSGFQPSSQREVGCADASCSGEVSPFDTLEVFLASGVLAWSSEQHKDKTDPTYATLNYVSWPSPGAGKIGYAFEDSPRFYAPPWGPTPIPSGAKVEPNLVATNGYDFTNNVKGDTYIFSFRGQMPRISPHGMRPRDFLTLTGPIPLLPDYAYGTWFTYWHQYSEDEAKGEVQRWNDDKLPIDIWALDMNWRNSSAMMETSKRVMSTATITQHWPIPRLCQQWHGVV